MVRGIYRRCYPAQRQRGRPPRELAEAFCSFDQGNTMVGDCRPARGISWRVSMGATVELAKIVDALEMMLEDWRSFLNVETGEVESVSLDILGEAEESEEKDPQSFENYDGEFELATKIVENRDKFLRLPT